MNDIEEITFPEKVKYKYQVCAVIFGADKSVLNIKLKEAYSLRSKFLHDGNIKHIRATTVIFLRDCVRKTLLKSISTKETKNNKIKK